MSSIIVTSDNDYVIHINAAGANPDSSFVVQDAYNTTPVLGVDSSGNLTTRGWFIVDYSAAYQVRNTSSSAPFCARFERGSTVAIEVSKDGLSDFSGTDVVLHTESTLPGPALRSDTVFVDNAIFKRLYVFWDDGTGLKWHYLTLSTSL